MLLCLDTVWPILGILAIIAVLYHNISHHPDIVTQYWGGGLWQGLTKQWSACAHASLHVHQWAAVCGSMLLCDLQDLEGTALSGIMMMAKLQCHATLRGAWHDAWSAVVTLTQVGYGP